MGAAATVPVHPPPAPAAGGVGSAAPVKHAIVVAPSMFHWEKRIGVPGALGRARRRGNKILAGGLKFGAKLSPNCFDPFLATVEEFDLSENVYVRSFSRCTCARVPLLGPTLGCWEVFEVGEVRSCCRQHDHHPRLHLHDAAAPDITRTLLFVVLDAAEPVRLVTGRAQR
jgi:hypothetical protein